MQNDGSISPIRAFLRKRWVKITSIIICVFIVVIASVIIILNVTRNATIVFNIAPVDALIQIDGNGEYHNGANDIYPGSHTVTISHNGLITKSFIIEAQSGLVTTLSTFLSSEDKSFSFYQQKDNYPSFQKLAEIASKDNNQTTDQDTSAETFIADYQSAYKLWQSSKLPIRYAKHGEYGHLTEDVTIRKGQDCYLTLCLEALMVGTSDHNLIKSLLEKNGFNAEEYEIIYKTY